MIARTVLLYSFSKFTLGHSARSSILATALTRTGVSAVLVHDQAAFSVPPCVTSVLMPNWRLKPGFAFDHKPTSDDMLPPEGYTAASLSDARGAIFLEAVKKYRPYTIYMDHFPFSTRPFGQEVLPALEYARHQGARVICGFRGVLSSADASDPIHQGRILDLLHRFADAVLIFLPAEFADLVPSFLLDSTIPVRFVGFLAPETSRTPVDPGTLDVIASVGGGADAAPQVSCIVDCARETPDVHYQLSVGPHLAGRREVLGFLQRIPSNVHLEFFIHDLPSRMRAAKLYLGMSGYNTLMAVMAAKRRCVLLPRASLETGEQCTWADLMRRLGFAFAVFNGPPYSFEHVSCAVRSALALDSSMALVPEIRMTGAEEAVAELLANE